MFWRCLAYHKMNPKPEVNSNINTMMKSLFNDYYSKPLNKINKANYQGVEFVACDKNIMMKLQIIMNMIKRMMKLI